MNQTERLYHIDKLLRANRCVPVSRFLDELGISIATFKRDIEHLRSNLNAPIEWDRSCRGYRLAAPSQTGPRYELPGVWFNAGEIHALLTGVRQLNPVFRDFRTDFPVFTRVPAAVFKSTCGGTSCKYGAFIDMT